MAIVKMHDSLVLFGKRVNLVELGNDAVHREHAVGGDELEAGSGRIGRLELGFEVGHVVVGVAEALGFAQANAVDDGCVVEGV